MFKSLVGFRHQCCVIARHRLHVHGIKQNISKTCQFAFSTYSFSPFSISMSKEGQGARAVGSVTGTRKITDVFEKQGARNMSEKRTTRSDVKDNEENHKVKYLNMPLEEKRKVYRCGSRYTELEMVPTWQEYSASLAGRYDKSDLDAVFEFDERLNKKVALWRGDITSLEVDAIVNAANNSLLGGGGVDGAIHLAAGGKLRAECAKLNGCPTGAAKITGGYKLPAKYVIHTVGPIGVNPTKLESCYRECLKLVLKNDIRTVAFPCISTGIYGYDIEKATPVALRTIRNWLNTANNFDKIDKLIFCVFLLRDVEVYEYNLLAYFPPYPVTPHTGKRKDRKTNKEPSVKEKAKTFGLKMSTDAKASNDTTRQAMSPVKKKHEAKSETACKEADVDSETKCVDILDTGTKPKTESLADSSKLETDTKTERLGESNEMKRNDSKDTSENDSSPVAKKKPLVWTETEPINNGDDTRNVSECENADEGDAIKDIENDIADSSSENVHLADSKI